MTMKEIAVLLLFLVMTTSASNEEMKTLTWVSGKNITLSHPVKEKGFLSLKSENSTKIIAKVFGQEMEIEDEEFQNRIFWDNVTGLFTVTILQEDNPKQINVESKENGSHIVSYNLILVNESFSAADQKNTSNNCSSFNLLDILKISFPIRCLIKSWGCSAKERFYCVLSNVLIVIIVIIIIVPIIFIIWCCRKKKNSTSDTQEQKCCCEVVIDFLERCNKEEKRDDTEMKPLSATPQPRLQQPRKPQSRMFPLSRSSTSSLVCCDGAGVQHNPHMEASVLDAAVVGLIPGLGDLCCTSSPSLITHFPDEDVECARIRGMIRECAIRASSSIDVGCNEQPY